IVVATSDLSKGVIAGVILSAIFFVAKISKIKVKETVEASRTVFEVNGQLFFASVEDFIGAFDFTVKNETIVIDFSNTDIWDHSGEKIINQLKMYDFS